MIMGNPLPTDPGRLIKYLTIAWNFLKSIFTPPKKDESPEDVARRNEQIRAFCDYINDQAKQVENAAVQQLQGYARYLTEFSQQNGGMELFSKYHIRTDGFVSQIDLLCAQLPGIIHSEVSKHLNDSDPTFHKIQWMLPGAEKEAAMQAFTTQVIQNAVEKCAVCSEQIMESIQNHFVELLQDAVGQEYKQLEKKEQTLAELEAAAGDTAEQERICTQAKLISACCQCVEEILSGSKEAV